MGLVQWWNGDWQGKREGTTMETYFNATTSKTNIVWNYGGVNPRLLDEKLQAY
jgi:hypothetical protein